MKIPTAQFLFTRAHTHTHSTLAPEAAEVVKIQHAKAPENSYHYTLPGFKFYLRPQMIPKQTIHTQNTPKVAGAQL